MKYTVLVFSIFALFTEVYSKEFNVGILLDGLSPRVEQIEEMVKKEIIELTNIEFDVKFPKAKRLDGQWSQDKINQNLQMLLSDPDIDLIITLGVAASHLVTQQGDLIKPVIAPFILDAELQGLPLKNGNSGIKNLSLINIPSTVDRDLKLFLEFTSLRKLTVLINPLFTKVIPSIKERFEKFSQQSEVSVQLLNVSHNVDSVINNIDKDAEGVYLTGLVHLSEAEFKKLVDGINNLKLPSITLLGKHDVELGVLSSLRGDFFPRISRRIALNAQRIFIGEKAHKLPVTFPIQEQLLFNMLTARQINFFPSWSMLTDAELINEDNNLMGELLTFNQAISLAVRNNLDVRARKLEVEAAYQEVKRARTAMYPDLSVSATAVMIDEDRAQSSFGSQAERTLTGAVTASQLLFSEKAWANLAIQNSLQLSRKAQLEQLKWISHSMRLWHILIC